MINHVQTFNARIALIRDWKARKKVRMSAENTKRCARDLGLSSAAVRDCLTAMESRKRKESSSNGN